MMMIMMMMMMMMMMIGSTQIDFIITRQRAAHLQAKRAYSDHTFPVGGSRLSGHYPIRAQLPMQSYHKPPSQDGPALPPIDLTALQTAVCRNTPEAQHMQACVAVKLRQVDTTNLVSVHRHVNRILLEAAATAFPKQPPADNRVSAQPAFRVTAKSVWHLYHTLKQPRVCAPREIFEKWKLAAAFARASKILRKQSHSLKKQFYESQVEQAEHAANHNDQRSLFLIIKRLSPKSHNIACRLRGSDGHLLTGPEQMQRIVAYGNETFAAKDDEHPRIPLATALRISSQDIAQELRKLGVSKAVPRHIAPAAVWKQCSQDLGCILSHAICHHMQPGNTGELDEDWKSSYVVWIPKPGKPQLDVTSLRPIGLSSPASKALAGSLRHHLLRGLAPALRMTPQFAYAKSRGTADALLRAHMHFEAVTKLVQDTQCTRFQKQAGGRARAVVGGLGLSLDLSKAFDGVTRAHIYSSMEQHGVPQDVITIIQQLHYRAQYVYQTGAQSGSTTTSNGIKQGCVIAPYLWNYFSLAYLSMLKERRSSAWIQQVLTLFADDVWGAWEIRSARDLDQAIADVSLILEALETLNMTINYSKTAILLKLVGKDARRLKQQHTFLKAGQPHLRVSVHGRDCGIPIKDQHEYLGTIVTYRHRHQRNMQHRLKACAVRYQGLRKLLNGSHHLAVHHRLRLWQACVCTSAFYAQHIVGVTTSTIATLTTTLTRHLRAIFRIPSHLTHITTREVWQQANLPMPGWALQHAQQQFIAKLEHRAEHAPDITTVSPIMQHIKREAARLEAMLMSEAEGLAKLPPQPPVVSCPYCQEAFVSENAMRVHCGLKHESVPKHSTRTPTVFCPELHSQAGMPACQLCKRQFWRWAHLVAHIESGACKCLGGDSEVRAPLPPDHAPAQIKQPPTVGLGLFEEENAANLPLVRRSAFQHSLDSWEKWLSIPAVRLELTQHCVLCHFWVADFRHMKQHLNRAHLRELPDLLPRSLNLCASFKSQLRRGSGCIWCGHKVGAPGRHVSQCTPLVQLCVAVTYCKDARARSRLCDQRGGGDIRQLLVGNSGVSLGSISPSHSGPPITEASSSQPATTLAGTTSIALPRTPRQSIRQQLLRTSATTASARSTPALDTGCSTTGTDHQSTQTRQDLHLVHEAGGGRNTRILDACGQGMEQQKVPGELSRSLTAAHGSLVEHDWGPSQTGSTGRSHRGKQEEDGDRGVAHGKLRMDLPGMEPRRETIGGRHQQVSPPAHGGHPHPDLPARASHRGSDPEIQLHCDPAQAGATGSQHSDFRSRGVSSWQGSCGTVSQFRATVRQCHHESHWSFDEKRHAAANTGGQTVGQSLLPAPTAARPSANDTAPLPTPISPKHTIEGDPPTAATADATARPLALPCIRFKSGSNSCYLNSFLNCMWLVTQATNHCHLLPKVFWVKSEQPHTATRLMGLRLLGWSHPQRQHDVAEIIDFLQPRLLATSIPGSWETRQQTPGDLIYTSPVGAQRCVTLPLNPQYPAFEVQELVNQWCSQSAIHALTVTPPWLFLQLPRFHYHAPGWPEKQTHAYMLTPGINIPKFRDPHCTDVEWVPYHIIAYIQHHGNTPASGHYTTVAVQQDQYWLIDDDKDPRLMTSVQLNHLSTNAYIVLVARDACDRATLPHPAPNLPACSSRSPNLLPDPHGKLEAHKRATARGRQLGVTSDISAESGASTAECLDTAGRKLAARACRAEGRSSHTRRPSSVHGNGDATESGNQGQPEPGSDSGSHQPALPG